MIAAEIQSSQSTAAITINGTRTASSNCGR